MALDIYSACNYLILMTLRLTPRKRAFITAYLGPANRVPMEAARIAGYRNPGSLGQALFRSLEELIKEEELRAAHHASMTSTEAIELLSKHAREAPYPHNLKALELIVKIHGLLSDKLDVAIDKPALMRQLEAEVETLTSLIAKRQRGNPELSQ
jgi:hypothetical protein